jgi:hypothetical protein
MLLFLFFIGALCSPNYDCDARTKVFTEHGTLNNDNFYAVFETYMNMYLTSNECDKIDNFRYQITTKIKPCIGIHCSNGEWKCPNNNVDCYHAEHIIPISNNIPELTGCDANIYGNMIMAYGLWNTQLSNGKLPEKHIIYGDVFLKAYNAVYKCCHNGNLPTYNPIVNECPIKNSQYWIMLIIIAVVAFISLIIGAIIKWLNRDIPIVVYDYDEPDVSFDTSDTSDTDTSL